MNRWLVFLLGFVAGGSWYQHRAYVREFYVMFDRMVRILRRTF